MPRILLIEDEFGLAESIIDAFRFHGYEVIHAPTAAEGLSQAAEAAPDAIILDVMLPDLEGFEVCRRIRAQGMHLPVLMLTARSEEVDRILSFEIGADDYITKPFSMRELIARVRAHLRRSEAVDQPPCEFRSGGLRIDFQRSRVFLEDVEISLTATEFSLLELLVRRRGAVVSREEIMNHLRGWEYHPNSRTIDNHILHLRAKIEADAHAPQFILTIHGSGYKFVG